MESFENYLFNSHTFTTKKINHVKDGAKFYIGKKSYDEAKNIPKFKKKIF